MSGYKNQHTIKSSHFLAYFFFLLESPKLCEDISYLSVKWVGRCIKRWVVSVSRIKFNRYILRKVKQNLNENESHKNEQYRISKQSTQIFELDTTNDLELVLDFEYAASRV